MKIRPHRIGLLLAIVLAVLTALLRIEWPLPEFAQEKLHEILAAHHVEVEYQQAKFDILGGVRLEGVSARYQGLIDIAASQFLLRFWPDQSIDLSIDSGSFHTGFLLLPLPEVVTLSGQISLQKDSRVDISGLHLVAGSLHVSVQGEGYPLDIVRRVRPSAKGVSLGQAMGWYQTVERVAKLLCRDPDNIWLVQLGLDEQRLTMQLQGKRAQLYGVDADNVELNADFPLSYISLEADNVGGYGAQLDNVGVIYRPGQSGGLWKANVRNAFYEKKGPFSGGVRGRFALEDVANLANWGALSGWASFNGAQTRFDSLDLKNFSGNVYGELSSDLLRMFGVKLNSKSPFYVDGALRGQQVDFVAESGEGEFYRLPYFGAWTEGSLNAKQVGLSFFDVAGPGKEYVAGSLNYFFKDRRADYRLRGRYNVGVLPWFGPEWEEAFEHFSGFEPYFACVLDDPKVNPVFVSGVGHQGGFAYQKLALDYARATFVSENKNTHVVFDAKKGKEKARGLFDWAPDFSGQIQGTILPKSLASAYFEESIEALEALEFTNFPYVRANVTKDGYDISLQTLLPLKFYGLEFEGGSAQVKGNQESAMVDPVVFGFAGGSGTASFKVNPDESSEGEFKVTGADFGRWSLFGPLSDALEGTFLGFTSLNLHTAAGQFFYKDDVLNVPSIEFKGDQNALQAWGDINTQSQTLNFRARLKTLGGEKPHLALLAPIVRPFTSIVEAKLTGAMDDPKWQIQLRTPRF